MGIIVSCTGLHQRISYNIFPFDLYSLKTIYLLTNILNDGKLEEYMNMCRLYSEYVRVMNSINNIDRIKLERIRSLHNDICDTLCITKQNKKNMIMFLLIYNIDIDPYLPSYY